jgi:hypothetical protein
MSKNRAGKIEGSTLPKGWKKWSKKDWEVYLSTFPDNNFKISSQNYLQKKRGYE